MPRDQHLSRRLLSLAACLEPAAAAELRKLAARYLKGEVVEPGELVAALPGRARPLDIGVSIDWDRGVIVEDDGYQDLGNGVGLMDISGPMMECPDLWECLFFGAVSLDLIVRALDKVTASSLDTLVIAWHSPGGSVCGSQEVVAAIERLKASGKRLVSLVRSCMCSAAVMYGCMADEVVTTPTGICGSVGTYLETVYDFSGMFAEEGITATAVASHPRKALGDPGLEVTDELLDDRKQLVATHFAEFAAHVAKHRKTTPEKIVALEARVYIGADAVKAGLCDRVTPSFDAFLKEITGQAPAAASPTTPATEPDQPPETPKEDPMDYKTLTVADLTTNRKDLVDQIGASALAAFKPPAATLEELEAAFPKASADFHIKCLKGKLTLAAAATALVAETQTQLEAKGKELEASAKRVSELEKLGNQGTGAAPVAGGATPAADGTFEAAVKAAVPANGGDLNKALVATIKAQPAMHQDWLKRGAPKISV